MRAFLESWTWDPTLIATLALAAVIYAVGAATLRGRSAGRAAPHAGRAAAFCSGLALAWLALLSPIGAYSGLFFFLHMTQHLLLVLGVIPLLLLSNPLAVLLWGLPRPARSVAGRLLRPGGFARWLAGGLTRPVVACSLFVAAVGIWHVPGLYDLAQGRTAVHDLEHAFFAVTAALYWWPVIQPSGSRRLPYGRAVLYLLPPFFESNLIGALLTFASAPLYASYLAAPRVWGLSVLQDQQIAGLVMWVPGGLYFLVPMLIMLAKALRQEEAKQEAAEMAGEALR
jgi:putative membrane protein